MPLRRKRQISVKKNERRAKKKKNHHADSKASGDTETNNAREEEADEFIFLEIEIAEDEHNNTHDQHGSPGNTFPCNSDSTLLHIEILATTNANPELRNGSNVLPRNVVPLETELSQEQCRNKWFRSAFNYDSRRNYSSEYLGDIGSMSQACSQCDALKWAKEPNGLCCSNGKIKLPTLLQPPQPLKSLLEHNTTEAREFRQHILSYNGAFRMTSFGARIIREPGFMPTFKIQGQISHLIGSLLPLPNEKPKFLQIYFMGDAHKEAEQRCVIQPDTSADMITKLQEMLHNENSYVRCFKTALDRGLLQEMNIKIDADKRPAGEHARRFNVPECNEIAAIIAGEQYNNRDIILQKRNNVLRRVYETHRSYDALQYPLLFPRGEDGYHFGIPQSNARGTKTVSCMDFYASRFMVRRDSFNQVHRCQYLLNQYAVDMYAKVESERLAYIKTHQRELRAESYSHLRDALDNDAQVGDIGQLCVLPSTFTGGPRYMHERAQDGMAYVRQYGRPDLFITFTCNAKWPEIERELFHGQSYVHRHDLVARVFRLKLNKLIDLITKLEIFGPTRCYIYTIEWQKRGLPHAHILVWLQNKIHADDIDKIISAELPDANEDRVLFHIVKAHMIHGPCGPLNSNSPCMKEGKCSKQYPKQFLTETQTNGNGYPFYRRRSTRHGGFETTAGRHTIDNRWVVPYCPLISKIFDAHINVEFCNSIKSIKYVCKYIHKGSDAVVFTVENRNDRDEVQQYQLGRYISTNEAFWRIFGFPIHGRYPSIQHLSVHLENGQRVYFNNQTATRQIAPPKETTLTAFFKLCQQDEFAATLLYHQVPSYYRWNNNRWTRRKNGRDVPHQPGIKCDNTLGRVYTVHPNQQECFFLRILLHDVVGPTSFEALRTVSGTLCDTYREACLQRGLLENDNQWYATLEEASTSRTPASLRVLFVILLTACQISNPKALWLHFRNDLAEDYKYQAQRACPDIAIDFNDAIYNLALIDIEDKVMAIAGLQIATYGLPPPTRSDGNRILTEFLKETSYDKDALKQYVAENERKLLPEQRHAYLTIKRAIHSGKGGLFFLDAPGGTGKTFLLNLLLADIRQHGDIALAVASSGVAATLLRGGRTVHSAFKLPLDLTTADNPTSNLKKTSAMAQVIKKCRLLEWDECTMAPVQGLQAVDKTLRDLTNCDQPMGGIPVVLAGDFRQTLPVVQGGTKADQLHACIKTSPLWSQVHTVKLSTNMRAHMSGNQMATHFAEQLLKLGEAKIGNIEDNMIHCSTIGTYIDSIATLLERVFPNMPTNIANHHWLRDRAILAPKNNIVNTINLQLLKEIKEEEKIYKAINTIADEKETINYPVEFLNSLEPAGLPPHLLHLKIGAPIMLLRNLDQPRLCNGTRLVVKKLMPHVIEATILTGCAQGEDVFLPRIPLISSDLPFRLKRLQFPIRLCFAMSINKSQGQTMKVVGLHLEEPCFAHGQLYVGCSRTGNQDGLFIYTPQPTTRNIVYKEVFGDLRD